MLGENPSSAGANSLCEYEPLILVTRGDELPKKNYEKKLHPTYETSIRIKNGGQQTSPHYVVKFYDQYRDLCEALKLLGVGEDLAISIDATFPLKYPKSFVGFTLTEQQLQHRCYLLNKWMGAIFANYHRFPTKAQMLISEFLSLNDNDVEEENNKELILALLRRKKENLIAEGIMAHTITGPNSAASSGAGGMLGAGTEGGSSASTSGTPMRLTSAALSQVQEQSSQRAQQANTPPTTNSGAGGVSSPAPAQAAAVRDEKEIIVGGFLGVRVNKGAQLVRKKDDAKLHHSYETLLRLLPLADAQYNLGGGKAEIDAAAYAAQVKTTELKLVQPFAAYRELKDDLERVHVYSSDNPTDSSAARQNGYKVIVIDAAFPPTMKMSALGVTLSDAQVQQRADMINDWLGILLKNFNVLPRDGKELITDFLGMPSAYSEKSPNAPDTPNTIIQSILRGTYVPPKATGPQPNTPVAPKKTLISYFTRRTADPAPTGTSTSAGTSTALTMTDNDTFDVSDRRPANSARMISDNESVLSGGDAMTDAGFEATSSEIMVGQYLGVCVIRGKPIAKKVGERRTHPSYEVMLRILPLEESILPEGEKRKIDAEVFNVHVEAGPMRIAFVFDAFRSLKTELESFRVYSLDRKSEVDSLLSRNPNDPVVLIDARFPRTYQRQSLGFKLNEPQLNQRSVMLNQWFGSLLQSFNLLPFLAKEHVIKFLTALDPSVNAEGVGFNPAKHPRDAVILAMLRQTYTPPIKKIAPVVADADSSGADGKGKKGKKGKRKGGNAEDGEADNLAPDGGCGCTVM